MTPVCQSVCLSSGLKLNVLRWPSIEPSEKTVLLVHGLGDTAWVWQGIAPVLARNMDVLAVDLRGHGLSDRVSRDDYSSEAMTRDLVELIDMMNLVRPALIGHSLGGAVVVRASAAAPTRFAAAVLVDYAPEITSTQLNIVRAVLSEMHRTYPSIADYAATLRKRHILADPTLINIIANGALQATATGFQPAFDLALLQSLGTSDGLAVAGLLHRLTLPVLVIRGALSWVLPKEKAVSMVESCPSARLSIVAMAGHSVQVDNPNGLLKAVIPFLNDYGAAMKIHGLAAAASSA